ncbi:MAG: long-chain-fatty-acid--CoA ligase [Longimicrobiales bacterium]
MSGPMMDRPLTPLHFLDRAAELFGGREVVAVEGAERRTRTWAQIRRDAGRAADALVAAGVAPGDRVAVLAWNSHAHLDLYFAVPAAGAVLLMVNVRLAPEQVGRILEHAGAGVVLAEAEFVPLVDAALALRRSEGEQPGNGAPVRMVLDPRESGAVPGWTSWPEAVSAAEGARLPRPAWAEPADERAPMGLCYTSGTTGEPKGVLYSHRAVALHTLAISLPDGFGLSEADTLLPAVPMFHANGWGLPYAAAMTGAGLVLPGPRPDAALLADLLEAERVTFAAGVPTVWRGVLDELRARPRRLAGGLRIHAGGAPTPPAMLEAYRREFGVEIVTGWGMTELTPVGMVTHPRRHLTDASPERLLDVRTSQGTPLPFVEVRVVDDGGTAVPCDGETPGELEVRGPWVTAGYYRRASDDSFRDGWLRTGDVATVDVDRYVRLVDRTKDLIRSGGEWISSVRLEHLLAGHPGVAEAAVVAVPDDRWGERPWATVVPRGGPGSVSEPEVLGVLEGHVPRWWVPDRVIFADAIPLTATGKYDKKALRARYRPPEG